MPRARWPEDSLERVLLETPVEGGGSVWIVGGTVRDALLGRPAEDLDLLVEGDPQPLLDELARLAGSPPALLERRAPATHRFSVKGRVVDVSACGAGRAREALARRDFTINALAAPLSWSGSAEEILDPHRGLADLRSRLLRPVRDDAFDDDPLRLLRGVRLLATLDGFVFAPGMPEAMRSRASLLRDVPPERVRAEMDLILESPRAGAALRAMLDAGLLFEAIPELAPLAGQAQGDWHRHDALEHTLRVVAACDRLQDGRARLGIEAPGRADVVVLKWAALLHDAGKPAAASQDGTGRIRFHGHDGVSAEIARATLRRLTVGSGRTDRIVRLVEHHLRLSLLASQPTVTERAIRRLVHQLGTDLPLLCLLAVADREGAGAGPADQMERIEHVAGRSLDMMAARGAELIGARPLLTGDEIMRILRLEEGPRVGAISRWLVRLQVDGRITTREQAVALLESLPPSKIP